MDGLLHCEPEKKETTHSYMFIKCLIMLKIHSAFCGKFEQVGSHYVVCRTLTKCQYTSV